jgi:hypothetical protein
MARYKLREISPTSLGVSLNRTELEYIGMEYVPPKEKPQYFIKKLDIIDGKKCIILFKDDNE